MWYKVGLTVLHNVNHLQIFLDGLGQPCTAYETETNDADWVWIHEHD